MNTDWFGTPFQPVLSRMAELVQAIRAFLTAENMKTVRFEGEHYQIKAAIRAPVMGPIDVPILLGAFNKGMLGVAGRVADGVIGHGLFTDRYWDERVHPRLDEAARQAGRDPNALRRWGWLITAIDDNDPKRAALDARRMIAFYLTVKTYDVLVDLHGWQEPVAAIRAAFANGDTAAMAEAVTDEMLDPDVDLDLDLTESEMLAIVAFMKSLTDPGIGLDPMLLTVPERVQSGLTSVTGLGDPGSGRAAR